MMRRLLTRVPLYGTLCLAHSRPTPRPIHSRSSRIPSPLFSRRITTSLATRTSAASPEPPKNEIKEPEYWANLIQEEQNNLNYESEGKPISPSLGVKAYRCTYSQYSEIHWVGFKKAFEMLVLARWERQAEMGCDPFGSRYQLKIFWEEDKGNLDGRGIGDEDLRLLRKRFNMFSKELQRNPEVPEHPDLGYFFLINDEVMKSLLAPNEGAYPFVWAVEASLDCFPRDPEEGDLIEPQHGKMDIDLISTFWCLLGPEQQEFDHYVKDMEMLRHIQKCCF